MGRLPADLKLFEYADDPESAFELLKEGLLMYATQPDTPEVPAIAGSRNPQMRRDRRKVRLIDLSHTWSTAWRLQRPACAADLRLPQPRGFPRNLRAGTEFHIGRIDMVANTGTYVDSPFHRYASGKDLAHLPLESLAHLDAVVVAASAGRATTTEAFRGIKVRGRAVLIRTEWDRHWRTTRTSKGIRSYRRCGGTAGGRRRGAGGHRFL